MRCVIYHARNSSLVHTTSMIEAVIESVRFEAISKSLITSIFLWRAGQPAIHSPFPNATTSLFRALFLMK